MANTILTYQWFAKEAIDIAYGRFDGFAQPLKVADGDKWDTCRYPHFAGDPLVIDVAGLTHLVGMEDVDDVRSILLDKMRVAMLDRKPVLMWNV